MRAQKSTTLIPAQQTLNVPPKRHSESGWRRGQAAAGALGFFFVALIVLSIGMSLGGPTGYAINPARDLGPRIIHFLLPIPGKGDSDWGYSWIPVVGPIIGGVAGALIAKASFGL